jgi:hypothetical protein
MAMPYWRIGDVMIVASSAIFSDLVEYFVRSQWPNL